MISGTRLLTVACAALTVVCAVTNARAVEPPFSESFESADALDSWWIEGDADRSTDFARTGSCSLYVPTGQIAQRSRIFATEHAPNNLTRVEFWTRGSAGRFVGYHFDAAGDWTHHLTYIRTPVQPNALLIRDMGAGLYVDDLSTHHATYAEYRDHVETHVDAWGPAIELNTVSHTYDRLTRTRAALDQGDPWHILMLGDSIQNDTNRSHWDALLRDRFDNADVNVTKSVRGSTGMNWYAAETDDDGHAVDRIPEWVTNHDPDLVMLGGISHQQDAEAYRTVIHKVRQIKPDAEFLIMTGLCGRDNLHTDPWNFDPDPNTDAFRHALMQIAAEEQVGFLDARAAWNQYIADAEQPLDFFKRDDVHMNNNGELVAAAIMDAYFAQSIPEPTALAVLGGACIWILGHRRNRRPAR